MKVCIVFPGIGYHSDKPLLYYSKKLAKQFGFEIMEIHYSEFQGDILKNKEDRLKAIQLGVQHANEILNSIDFKDVESVLILAKSIGTTISLACMKSINVKKKFVLYTPIEETFNYDLNGSIVFHGMEDLWLTNLIYFHKLKNRKYMHYEYEECNHSLETGDVIKDIQICEDVMNKTKEFMKEEFCVSSNR